MKKFPYSRFSTASRFLFLGFALLACANFSSDLFALPYAEQGDAGDLPGTAQVTMGPLLTPLSAVNGMLTLTNGISDGDMFAIVISDPLTFSATTTVFGLGVNNFDTQLFLFNAAGFGVYANDDDPTTGSPQSTLPAGNALLTSLPTGLYYILITGSGRYPVDSVNHLIFPNFTDGTTDQTRVYGPNSGSLAVAGYLGNSNEGGKYSIALTGAQFAAIPEPSAIGLTLLGLSGVIAACRKPARA